MQTFFADGNEDNLQNKTKQNPRPFKKGLLYLQSLQLLQLLEGTSLDDADLVVFQMPRTTEAATVKDRWNTGVLTLGSGHAGMVTRPLS